ncbi:hypothetical protein O3P69_007721 [Scylla paramamosain]|uniref:Uncharacterized protein n=1 Tax=Scylla paramamosain TaxID=85552 RepID=A0AAW0UX95_SCYPA
MPLVAMFPREQLAHDKSVSRRLQELLSKEELGGEKPTDLLRRMKKLLGDKYTSFDKELFLQLFYQRLPPDTQRCLFTVKNKLSVDELATLADEFMATLPQGLEATQPVWLVRSRRHVKALGHPGWGVGVDAASAAS